MVDGYAHVEWIDVEYIPEANTIIFIYSLLLLSAVCIAFSVRIPVRNIIHYRGS